MINRALESHFKYSTRYNHFIKKSREPMTCTGGRAGLKPISKISKKNHFTVDIPRDYEKHSPTPVWLYRLDDEINRRTVELITTIYQIGIY